MNRPTVFKVFHRRGNILIDIKAPSKAYNIELTRDEASMLVAAIVTATRHGAQEAASNDQ